MSGLVLVLFLQSQAASPVDAKAWAGAWKSADPEFYATIEITEVGPDGLTLSWDENAGINSVRETGRAFWDGPGRKAVFDTDTCSFVLTRGAGDRLEAAIDEHACFMWSESDRLAFVRADAVVHEKTSFDCA